MLCHDAKAKGLEFDNEFFILYDDVFAEKSIKLLKPTEEIIRLCVYSNENPCFRLKEIDDIKFIKCVLDHTYEFDGAEWN